MVILPGFPGTRKRKSSGMFDTGGIRRTLAAGLTLVAVALIPSCGESGARDEESSKKIRVVTTTGMIADMVREVAGDRAEVLAIMRPGTDPHGYKATESDVVKLAGADIIFYNGLHLEGRMGTIFEKMARRRPVIAVGDAVPREEVRPLAGYENQFDPHIWVDVALWMKALDPISRELTRLDPEAKELYEANAAEYRSELEALNVEVKQQIQSIPQARRVLVTAHDAFGYFGRRYGIEVVALQGISTVTQASVKDRERVVDLVVERKIKAIFIESSVPRRNIEAVQEDCRRLGHDVVIGVELFSDSMGKDGTPEGTYLGMIRHNVQAIVEALR